MKKALSQAFHFTRRSAFELATPTLFIDEVGDIPMNMQIKLLRVLQEHRFMRVGGTKEIHSSFRLIAATNRDSAHVVWEGDSVRDFVTASRSSP